MEKLHILDKIVPDYTNKFLRGEFKLEEMPLLAALGKKVQEVITSHTTDQVYIIACQHLLEPQVTMFRLFIELGIDPTHISILPKIYSVNKTIASELIELGCHVFESALLFHSSQRFDEFHQTQCETVVDYALTTIPKIAKVIILDDGGGLIRAFAQHKNIAKYFQGGIYAVEQTASGKNILLGIDLPFIVTNVAGSIEKIQIETSYIIRHTAKRILEYFVLHAINSSVKILVLGKGPIGKTMVEALITAGYYCESYDILDTKPRPLLTDYDVIVGATGANSIALEDLKNLKPGCHLISISSSDREFPSQYLRSHAISGKGVHDTYVCEMNNIHLANGGFPISFKGERIECYPLEIDVTMMKLAEGVLSHAIGKTNISVSLNSIHVDLIHHKLVVPTVTAWSVILIGLCILKLATFGFWSVIPIGYQNAYIVYFFAIMVPWIYFIERCRKLEQMR